MTDFWQRRNVLVTGATGLLGSWMCRTLLARGATVTCLIRDHVPGSLLRSSGDVDRVQVVHGALEDYATVLRAINEYEVDTVFHLGAQTIVGTANRSVMSTFDANIRGTWNLLEACRVSDKLVQRVVVASSDKAYGEHESLPYTEDLPLLGTYPYDASKACAELLTRSFHETFGVPVAVTRCGNLFGGGDLNFNRLVPGTVRSALLGERPIVRSDGLFERDYFYVEDAVGAYLLLAERMQELDLVGEAFNFGTEQPMTVLEVVDRVLQKVGRSDLEPDVRNEASGEIRRQFLDCSKARRRLGWRPAFAFDDGLERAIDWYRSHLRS
ncbi:MAG TPA: NAD-dependent epimerase/dehydratase family protein [bacterium]|nr:NAD-dependent epimerase/dehydratase family protein [bacterium]